MLSCPDVFVLDSLWSIEACMQIFDRQSLINYWWFNRIPCVYYCAMAVFSVCKEPYDLYCHWKAIMSAYLTSNRPSLRLRSLVLEQASYVMCVSRSECKRVLSDSLFNSTSIHFAVTPGIYSVNSCDEKKFNLLLDRKMFVIGIVHYIEGESEMFLSAIVYRSTDRTLLHQPSIVINNRWENLNWKNCTINA